MLESLFIRVLNMSLTACIVIAAVLLLRILLRKAPRIFSYALWAVVLFRLLCPVSFSADFSLLGAAKPAEVDRGRMEYIPENIAVMPEPAVNLPFPAVREAVNAVLPQGKEEASVNPMGIVVAVGAGIWLMGMLVMGGYGIVTLILLKRKLKSAVRQEENIYITPNMITPFVLGIFRPRIYLPSMLREEEKEYILLHERIHIRRGDHVLRIAAYLALCLHWFNPFVWAAFFMSGQDMEMSCDEAVIRKLGYGVKKEYSTSLLTLATGRKGIGGVPLAFGEGDTGSRIKNVLHYKKPAVRAVIAAIVLCAAAAVVLSANPPAQKEEDAMTVPEEYRTDYGAFKEEPQEAPVFQTDTYEVSIRSVSRSARAIDRYVRPDDMEIGEEGEPLFFAEDCAFTVNYEMAGVGYEEVSFDAFADLIAACAPDLNKPCMLTFRDGLVVKADLESAYVNYGISFREVSGNYEYEEFTETGMEQTIKDGYTLVRTEEVDLSDRAGLETAEVYIRRNADDWGNGGYVLFRNAEGNLIWIESAFTARAGWQNIYFGEKGGISYILKVHIEDREEYGEYAYEVFRPDGEGSADQIAGSAFEWGSSYEYDDALFEEWASGMEDYLENSYLVLSTQDGVIRTEKVSEAGRYRYETLKR